MPVVTAAVSAITVAATVTTAATVATAVVATSALIGTIGIGLTAVGMITKNKDLLKAGQIAGYVGLAGGLAGGAIGGFGAMASGGGFLEGAAGAYQGAAAEMSKAWDSGIGSLFTPDPGIAGAQQEMLGKGIVAASNNQYADAMAPAMLSYGPDDQAILAKGVVAGTQGMQPPAPVPVADATTAITDATKTVATQAPVDQASMTADHMTKVATHAPVGQQAPVAPTTASAPQGPGYQLPSGVQPPGPGTDMKTWWDKIPDWQKHSMLMVGGQAISGLAGGYFQGLSAEQQLELNKLIADRNEQQRQYTNKNAAYAPLVGFKKPGLVAAGGKV